METENLLILPNRTRLTASSSIDGGKSARRTIQASRSSLCVTVGSQNARKTNENNMEAFILDGNAKKRTREHSYTTRFVHRKAVQFRQCNLCRMNFQPGKIDLQDILHN